MGTFDGDGHTISGLKIVNISKNLQNVGLFGVLDGAVVKNLVIEDARVYGYNHVGILAGQIKGESVITDVTLKELLLPIHHLVVMLLMQR